MEVVLKKYFEFLKSNFPQASEEDITLFVGGLTVERFNKRDYYIEAYSVPKSIGLIYKGLVRCSYIKEDGKEITYNFLKEKEFVVHYPAFLKQERTKYSFQCIEPTIMINMSHEHVQLCLEKCPSLILSYFSGYLGEKLAFFLDRIDSFLFEDAETRYLNFVNNNKELANRVSLSYLSSYLGIERQSLSRIRKKLIENKS